MIPIVKLYRGYANENELIVMGHVFRPNSKTDYNFEKKSLKNARSIIALYKIKTIANYDVYLHFNNQKIHTKTLDDGYFKFCIPLDAPHTFGWQNYLVSHEYDGETIVLKETFIRPHQGNLGIISDIDDTFLVSHTQNIFKKLYILLFKNLNDRKIFENVVLHYQALSTANRNNKSEQNAFFYISSSEWNLYQFIVRFTKLHELPRAVVLLKNIKTGFFDFFKSGRGSHHHKFEKIKHVLEFYPNLKYVLLGDDSQQDPYLYEHICKIFPITVKAVYIRQTGKSKKTKVSAVLDNLTSLEVEVCYFKDSNEAIAHSKKIGLI
ncbi:App1 family protein [Flavobacterium agrisoli]|uniref:App1 family protein n=1 Tax=Flavobacterium agrisoli TaxID=2793066 RepID=A0A934PNF9_9FLAO|nr:App1 family protein [Flavobacterium agrisoli]MBK0370420.1 App1 family protein [Flavobacterium agrisoli]